MRKSFILIYLAASANIASAGGLFGDGGLIRGEVGAFLDLHVERPITRPIAPIEGCTLSTELCLLGEDSPTSLETLEDQKTDEQLDLERLFSDTYDLNAGNICITSQGSCSIDQYTLSGSSCFCEFSEELSFGVVR